MRPYDKPFSIYSRHPKIVNNDKICMVKWIKLYATEMFL